MISVFYNLHKLKTTNSNIVRKLRLAIMVSGHISAIILSSTFLLADSGYNTIYLMEFENVNSDFTVNSFKTALPDLIIENYSFRNDIVVEYAQNISPYERTVNYNNTSLIVNGKFKTEDDKKIMHNKTSIFTATRSRIEIHEKRINVDKILGIIGDKKKNESERKIELQKQVKELLKENLSRKRRL